MFNYRGYLPMSDSKQLNSLNVFGIPITQLHSYRHAEDVIVQRIRNKQKTFCVAINPEKIYRSQVDEELRKLINSADFHICDGIGAAVAARILHRKKIGRVTGVQLFLNLMARAEKEGLKVFLLGASPQSNDVAFTRLKEMHPGLDIVGRQDGYFDNDDDVIQHINDSEADMLFVAMGSPRQEKWVNEHRGRINAPYCMGVGGTLDVVSGNVKWAPKLFRKTGTEFLYRLISEPKRIKRQIVLPKFMFLVFKGMLLGQKS
jgi:N-acetylglucosaminyldiphosphoundecaprenol N-acetyl-beta-D-mannosaminyltransferase